jgi:hypothetical protein
MAGLRLWLTGQPITPTNRVFPEIILAILAAKRQADDADGVDQHNLDRDRVDPPYLRYLRPTPILSARRAAAWPRQSRGTNR